ncbi:unnamed protein product [Oppiella nova]|uniref:Uncharacterized protein n=1 Tax=Oppiella nova TaxID=334625 RepID=A0A7R9MI57_9ACAR|nr:unnamed protein product [Oppiella nova]CAG2177539.1 unnamed protein product [Oppiella nova]
MTMSDFVDDSTLRLAGRLDMDSEVDGNVTEEALEQLRKGVELKDGMTLPAQANKVEQPEWLWDRDPPVVTVKSVV